MDAVRKTCTNIVFLAPVWLLSGRVPIGFCVLDVVISASRLFHLSQASGAPSLSHTSRVRTSVGLFTANIVPSYDPLLSPTRSAMLGTKYNCNSSLICWQQA
ncbi:hypothetical protein BD309DRAFT_945053 [Dichomitus squalens]|uniref:Uncharacterized protein n=1 Tax=Dichomitus squalens TaxID=114155 RepID=A0A4Q9Q2J1_9APHY|nr:hypothetical protein BD309DRAFT_945053 [Dichomitus squalens]TBU61339.1 hypothetical protein BD310DRAFT_921244 [Dichomitus squalens]